MRRRGRVQDPGDRAARAVRGRSAQSHWHRRLAARDVRDCPVGQQPFQVLGPGRAAHPPGQTEQVVQPLVGERAVRLAQRDAQGDVEQLGRNPVSCGRKPPG